MIISVPLRIMSHLKLKQHKTFIYGILLIRLSFCEELPADSDWSYRDQESWNYQCGGTLQSPIDIPRRGFRTLSPSISSTNWELAGLPEEEFPPLELKHYNITPELTKIRNTGETEGWAV